MKVGLLVCDHVLEKYRPIAGGYEDMFPALLPKVKMTKFFVCDGQFPADVHDCDAYVCTGSKYSVYDDEDWIKQLKAFVAELHEQQKTYVGVCFGHQMLAEALGGKVRRAQVGWSVGVHPFKIAVREPWMTPFQPRVNLLMLCQDQVHRLPEGSTVLAAAPDCPVGMFTVGKRMLGIQAHPEFPVAYAQAVIQDRIDRIGAEKAEAALQSLSRATHGELVAGWITAFLR